MIVVRNARGARFARTLIVVLGLLAAGCIDRPASPVEPRTQSAVELAIQNTGVDSVDLLVEVDNSNSMTQNQQNIFAQLPTLINALVNPPLDAMGNVPYPPVKHLHVGVIDQDLGTAGSTVPGCAHGDSGDDGLLNPIHFGAAEQTHEPTTGAPAGFRPTGCTDPAQFPAFITFESGTTDATAFAHDFQCNAGLYISGCGLEQQLEAVWRAVLWHDASDHAGNADPNAGFLRDDALLAILMLTDEDDMSVVDCRYVRAGVDPPCPNANALDVFNSASMAWASSDLNLRTYLYTPCGAQDPTWPLDRYVDPANASNGLLSLKPGHPELVIFAAITGVPLAGDGFPVVGTGTTAATNWDALLGTPGPNGPNDFCGRNATSTGTAVDTMSLEGHVSMRQANADPNCPSRVVPACRREGARDDPMMPACATSDQYFAWPARRVVEVARRFDQATLCGGMACNNGLVTSICGNDYTSAMNEIIGKISSRLRGKCLPRVLQQTTNSDTTQSVDCLVREYVPTNATTPITDCTATGRQDSVGSPAVVTLSDGVAYHVCDITQVHTNADATPAPGSGWYYDRHPSDAACAQEITFTADAQPVTGSTTRLECIQSITTPSAM